MVRNFYTTAFTGIHRTRDGFVKVVPTLVAEQGHQLTGIPKFDVCVFIIMYNKVKLLLNLTDSLFIHYFSSVLSGKSSEISLGVQSITAQILISFSNAIYRPFFYFRNDIIRNICFASTRHWTHPFQSSTATAFLCSFRFIRLLSPFRVQQRFFLQEARHGQRYSFHHRSRISYTYGLPRPTLTAPV